VNYWVGLAAFVLSLIAFVGTTTVTWLRWPRIAVDITGRTNAIITPGSKAGGQFDLITVAVVNNGAEAFTVRSIGLAMVKQPDGTRISPMPVIDYESLSTAPRLSLPDGPALPTRIDSHDVKLWTYHNEILGNVPKDAEVIAYVDRYKAFRFWPHCGRSLVKRSFSQRKATRGVDHIRRQPGRESRRNDSGNEEPPKPRDVM